MKDTWCHSQSVYIIHPQIQKLKKKENLRRCCCTEEFNVIQCKSISQGHPSKNTQSTHITHVYIHLCIQINKSSKKMWMIKSMQQDAGFPEFLNFSSGSNSSYYSFPASCRIVDFYRSRQWESNFADDHVKSNVKSNTVINHILVFLCDLK